MLVDAISEKHNKRRMDGPVLDHFNWDHPPWDVTMEDEENNIKGKYINSKIILKVPFIWIQCANV